MVGIGKVLVGDVDVVLDVWFGIEVNVGLCVVGEVFFVYGVEIVVDIVCWYV